MRGLLPCPFCGWAAIMREWTSGMHYYRAECSNTEGCDCHGLQHLTLGEAIAAWNRRTQPENEALTCEGCVDKGQYENEVEYGYPSPCTRCKRRSPDNYRRKPERSEG